VFINMDPQCESLESYLGDMPMHWARFPLEKRYIAGHIHKIFPANWKIAQEAFMEAYHNIATHAQFGVYFGGAASEANQYDPMGNYARALGQGEIGLPFNWTPTPEERLDAMSGHGYPVGVKRVQETYLEQGEKDLFKYELSLRRQALREVLGAEADELTDFEVFGGGFFTLFPNFHPWWAYDEFTYRVRPYRDEPEMCIMETYLLRPFKGERPKPVPTRYLGVEDSHMEAADLLGPAARIFDQDEYNIPMVQKGLHTLKHAGKGITPGLYQATKIRHFHNMWDNWVYGDNKPTR
jgi:hypothetical protein